MSVERSRSLRRVARAGLLAITSLGWAEAALAQDHTADPYKPYNQQYQQFVYPTYPSGLGLTPNQNLLEQGGYTSPNQFQRFLDIEEGPSDEFNPVRRRSGPGIPYYSAYRQYDKDYGRIYQPNLESDRAFHQDQRSKHDKYMAYLKERDPRKRAELYRAYTKDANRVSRDLALPRSQVARDAETGTAKADDRAPRRRPATTPSARGSQANPTTKPAARPRKPSEILRESEELEAPKRLTAPGLAPRSATPRPD